MKESDELYLLRFRYGRAVEVLYAYKTFLLKEVKYGNKNTCKDKEQVEDITHTLLVVYYSYIYSMFDKSGTDFITVSEQYLEFLSEDGKIFRRELIEIWEKYKIPITKLRNNVGFHGGSKIKSHDIGYGALGDIHTHAADFIINHLALFFMEIDIILPNENYNINENHAYKKEKLLKKSKELKEAIENDSFADTVKSIREYFKQ
ncbi:MAG: hypothetical protein U0U67_15510 [Chitinophagales bacterium]